MRQKVAPGMQPTGANAKGKAKMLTLHIDTDTFRHLMKNRGAEWLESYDVRVYLAPGAREGFWMSGSLYGALRAA